MISTHQLTTIYRRAHNLMRNSDGLQPQEAFDELLKYLFFKQLNEERGPELVTSSRLFTSALLPVSYEDTVPAIRSLFTRYLESVDSWSSHVWRDKEFHLSDGTLLSMHQLFEHITFHEVPFDIRSAALKEFLSPEIRRGLGIYLTPDDIVRAMVDFVSPAEDKRVCDPACGSGTFLIEVLKAWGENGAARDVWGTDKNPRMLLLAELNMGHVRDVVFHGRLADSLVDRGENFDADFSSGSFDAIFTNPPFGVVLNVKTHDLSSFATCRTPHGATSKKQYSEVVFMEQSLKLLKPGGDLAIVLPKSVVTNVGLKAARAAIDNLGTVYAVITLPPETFYAMGTQTTTVVLFIRKYEEQEDRSEQTRISLAKVTNVGYDSTGRVREGNQLPRVSRDLRASMETGSEVGVCKTSPLVPKGETLSMLSDLLSKRSAGTGANSLGDVVEIACTGKTPARSDYAAEGLFVVKVGNLTGKGISWVPRERNFVTRAEETRRRRKAETSILKEGDILLTASAHSPLYIAKKVDIVTRIPAWLSGAASFVGEVMMLRPDTNVVDPFALLAFLRHPETVEEIQHLVRGQTAHLHPRDILNIRIPDAVLYPSKSLESLIGGLLLAGIQVEFSARKRPFKQRF